MAWEVGSTGEFHSWWVSLSEDEQDDVALSVRHLVANTEQGKAAEKRSMLSILCEPQFC